MQNGIRNVVSRMNGIEKPSTPSLKRIVSVSQAWLSTSWKAGVAGVEPRPGDERQQEGRDRRGERRPAGVGARRLVVAAQGQDEGRADERQDEKAGEDAEAEHQCAPAKRYQVTRAATPISMAKA